MRTRTSRLNFYNIVAAVVLSLGIFCHATGVGVLDLSRLTAVTDSTYFQGRKIAPDSVARKVSFGLLKDTTRALARISIHDTLVVRLGSLVAPSPCIDSTVTYKWIRVKGNDGDTLWVRGCK